MSYDIISPLGAAPLEISERLLHLLVELQLIQSLFLRDNASSRLRSRHLG